MNKRPLIWGAVLMGAAALIYFAPQAEQPIVAPTARTAPRQAASAREATGDRLASQTAMVLAIRPRVAADGDHEPFPAVTWNAPPPDATVKAGDEPPPEPQAPPLPFKVMGQYSEADQHGVFLLHNDQNLVARVGDTIANNYKVESLRDGVLTLLYLPLQQRQTLLVSAPN